MSYLQLKGTDYQNHAVVFPERFFLSLYTRKVSAWGNKLRRKLKIRSGMVFKALWSTLTPFSVSRTVAVRAHGVSPPFSKEMPQKLASAKKSSPVGLCMGKYSFLL